MADKKDDVSGKPATTAPARAPAVKKQASPREQWARAVPPFEVEFGDPNCRNHTINTFKIKVRGAFSVAKMASREEGPRDIGSDMSKVPATPGQRLVVTPSQMKCVIYDPLEKDPQLLKRLGLALKGARRISGTEVRPAEKQELKVNPDQLATLCEELLRKQENKSITVTQGKLPTRETLSKLPGEELSDMWNSNVRRPKYKSEVDEWEREIDRTTS